MFWESDSSFAGLTAFSNLSNRSVHPVSHSGKKQTREQLRKQIAQRMDPAEWYKSMPMITKTLMTGVFVTTLAANFGLLNPYYLFLDFERIWNGFQVRAWHGVRREGMNGSREKWMARLLNACA